MADTSLPPPTDSIEAKAKFHRPKSCCLCAGDVILNENLHISDQMGEVQHRGPAHTCLTHFEDVILLLSTFNYSQWSVVTSTCDAAKLCLTRLQININHSQQLIPDEEIQTNSMCHCHAIKATVAAQVTQ